MLDVPQITDDCVYVKIVRRNNQAVTRDSVRILVWNTPSGSLVLAFDLTIEDISGVFVDAAENYFLKEEVLFFRWINCEGNLLSK